MTSNVSNLIGQRFGRLVVTSISSPSKQGRSMVVCKCDCGNEKIVRTNDMKRGKTKSCGCMEKENRKNLAEKRRTHGMSTATEYYTWKNMKQRCYNPESEYYYLYGGRGIKVCDRWLESFDNFYKDMGARPEGCSSIERIDGDKDYYLENCRWASHTEQSYNTSQNVHLTVNGETKCITEWAKVSPVTSGAIKHRMNQGWKPYDCVFKASSNGGNRAKNFYEYKGEKYTLPDLCKKFDIGQTTFSRWYKRGMPVEEIVDKYRRK